MGWILILFIWLVAPFAQLGIIIYLLVLTDKYKKQIRELERAVNIYDMAFKTGNEALDVLMVEKLMYAKIKTSVLTV